MLVMQLVGTTDNARLLRETLPSWRPLVDYYSIGVVDGDDTRAAEEVVRDVFDSTGVQGIIERLPLFEGYGSAYQVLADRGRAAFPDATFGLAANTDWKVSGGQRLWSTRRLMNRSCYRMGLQLHPAGHHRSVSVCLEPPLSVRPPRH